MTDKKALQDILQKPGNSVCGDCGDKDVQYASCNLGVFLCQTCAGLHRSLGTGISRTKSLKLDNWDENALQIMEAEGNLRAQQKYEQHVPPCYKRPTKNDALVLKEQWIRAKYERGEFADPDKQPYLAPRREGYLMKRGRDDKRFQRRRFVLDTTESTIKYYNKEDARVPKASLRIDDLNVTLVPEKVGNPNAMQIIFPAAGTTRSIFVYAETGKDIVDWYVALRAAKLARLAIAYPGAPMDELTQNLMRDFMKEGWLSKTGPRPGDAYRRRWCTLDKRSFMYYEDPLDPTPKGEIFIGPEDRGFKVRDGVPQSVRDPGYAFTLRTPERHFHFAAESEEEKQCWMMMFNIVIDTPLSPQDSSSMFQRIPNK